jgi:hypothetical protein
LPIAGKDGIPERKEIERLARSWPYLDATRGREGDERPRNCPTIGQIQFSSRLSGFGRSTVRVRSRAIVARSSGQRRPQFAQLDGERARGALKIVGLLGANFGDDVREQLAMKLALGCDSPPRCAPLSRIGGRIKARSGAGGLNRRIATSSMRP